MVFRLRYQQHDFELSPGRFLLGRSTECQLSLDDPLVSRKHALLVVTAHSVEVEDLGSRNGVLVNGERISRPMSLSDGDRITIGSQDMTISAHRSSLTPNEEGRGRGRVGMDTIASMQRIRSEPPKPAGSTTDEPPPPDPTARVDAFRLLGGVADKAFALGRADEAERLLNALLENVVQLLRSGGEWDQQLVEHAGRYGSKLAAATGKARWVDYVVELHTLARRPCSAVTIDELHAALRKVKTINITALRAYLKVMRELSPSFGPADRFLVQRIEGLERLVAAG